MTRPNDQSDHGPYANFGILSFDGAGNASASVTLVASGDTSLQSISGSFTGSYTPNSDGTITLNLSGTIPGVGSTSGSFVVVTTDGGAGFYILETDDQVHVVSGSGRAAAPTSSLSGTYALNSTRVPNGPNDQPGTTIGTITFDGAGNVTGILYVGRAGKAVQTGSFTGTYAPNADGTFTLNLSFGASAIGAVTDGGAGFYMVQNGGGTNLSTFQGRKQ